MGYVGWGIVFVCLFAAGTLFFSVSAMALRAFSLVKLNEAFKKTNKNNYEEITQRLTEKSEELILTCLLYRLLLNICILLLLVWLVINIRNSISIGSYLITFFISIIIFFTFSLAIPHAWAKYAGEKTLSRIYMLLLFFAMSASPFLYLFKLYDGFIRRLAGVAEVTLQEQQEEKQEEFITGLEQHRTDGVLDEEEQEMIENVLELTNSTANEIMTPRTDIIAVDCEADLQTVLDTIAGAGHTRVPVYKENIDNIVGLIYAKDLLPEIGKNPSDFRLSEKIREAYFVPETKLLRNLLHEFQNQKLHIAVVLDEYGGTAGIVTLEDILEELVGEIADEYEETPTEPIQRIDEFTIEVDARTSVDDLNDEFEIELPEDEDYETIGGFVFSRLGYIPKTGVSFDYENLKFTVTAAETRNIKRLRISKIEKSEKE